MYPYVSGEFKPLEYQDHTNRINPKVDKLSKEWNVNFYKLFIKFYKFSVTDLNLRYKLQGEVIKIKTVDLNQDWQLIRERLLEVVKK